MRRLGGGVPPAEKRIEPPPAIEWGDCQPRGPGDLCGVFHPLLVGNPALPITIFHILMERKFPLPMECEFHLLMEREFPLPMK